MSVYKRKMDVDVLSLIAEVKKHECLWNVECSEYRRRGSQATLRAWNNIAGKLNNTGLKLRVKWKNLKDTYRKELKRNYIDNEYQGLWIYFETMDFLRNSILSADKVEEMPSDNEVAEELQEVIEANTLSRRKINYSMVKLVVEVKKHECLWKKEYTVTGCSKQEATLRAWEEVAEKLGRPVPEVINKWRNMRYKYKYELKKNFTNGEYMGLWQYFSLMSFLKINLTDNTAFEVPASDEDDNSDEETAHENNDIENEIKIEVESLDMDTQLDCLDSLNEVLPEKRQKIDDDEFDLMFLKSLAPFFRGMDNVRKLALRTKIQNMVMNELTRTVNS